MDIPFFESLEAAIVSLYGEGVKIKEKRIVSGGDANDAALLTLNTGDRLFAKLNSLSREGFFTAEAEGLSAIASTNTIRTPKLLALGKDKTLSCVFLLMEYITGEKMIPDYWEVFAEELYAMHKADASGFVKGGRFGFLNNNYIGLGKQRNSPRDLWIDFFRECRLEPQFKLAEQYFGQEELKKSHRLLEHLDKLLTEPQKPSLIHGDLWSGNFVTGTDGKAWLIDPAAYVGHPEADLAMTELFGGFSSAFYSAYRRVSGMDAGYQDRRDLYNLYHLLNHLNLFGGGYYSGVIRILNRYA